MWGVVPVPRRELLDAVADEGMLLPMARWTVKRTPMATEVPKLKACVAPFTSSRSKGVGVDGWILQTCTNNLKNSAQDKCKDKGSSSSAGEAIPLHSAIVGK